MSSKKRHNYKNLKIWQIGLEISFDLSDVVAELPKHERYGLSSQLSRCSVSAPSNIAEGSVKSDKSFSNYVDRALGLSFESETKLLVSNHRKYINKKY